MADLYPPRTYYPPQLMSAGSSNNSDDDQPPSPTKSNDQPQKAEAKPQATFLTKLYKCVYGGCYFLADTRLVSSNARKTST